MTHLGLMGGSLAGALRGRCRTVVGVARRNETVDLAMKRGLVDWGTTDVAAGVGRADVVVLATPVLEPERQDYLVATLSHLPYLLACALVATADAATLADPAAWQIVAGGFRDTSRVASSDVTMMLDILLTNREEVLKAVRVYQSQLTGLARLLEAGDEGDLHAALTSIRHKRKEMFP